jgi:uncharacterized protein (DUF4415 family)
MGSQPLRRPNVKAAPEALPFSWAPGAAASSLSDLTACTIHRRANRERHTLFSMRHERPERQKKVRVCIRLDSDLLDYFQKQAALTAHSENPAGYQTLICEALHEFLDTREYLDRVNREHQYTVAPGVQ